MPGHSDEIAPSGETTRAPSHIDVEVAERIFKNLSQEFSNRGLSEKPSADDQNEVDENTRFDLEGYLRNEKRVEQEGGHHDKHVDVIWDVTVQGLKDTHHYQPTFADAMIGLFGIIPTMGGVFSRSSKGEEKSFDILTDMYGIAKAGEMVLVLGRPGSGCSTFLKTIANQRGGFSNVIGDVTYNGIPSEKFGPSYGGEAVYNHEDDVFLPTLTVNQVRRANKLSPFSTEFWY
jgi:ATP-binding cassette subfamily G (WHITE) protein 2 (SNQ2)